MGQGLLMLYTKDVVSPLCVTRQNEHTLLDICIRVYIYYICFFEGQCGEFGENVLNTESVGSNRSTCVECANINFALLLARHTGFAHYSMDGWTVSSRKRVCSLGNWLYDYHENMVCPCLNQKV